MNTCRNPACNQQCVPSPGVPEGYCSLRCSVEALAHVDPKDIP